MWDCGLCGCRAIAADVPLCPQCQTPKEEAAMPKVTSGGPSNGWEPKDEDGPETVPPPPPASALKDEHVAYATAVLNVPPDEAAAMTKPELAALAQAAQPAPAAPAAPATGNEPPAPAAPAESPSAPPAGQ